MQAKEFIVEATKVLKNRKSNYEEIISKVGELFRNITKRESRDYN